MSKYTDDIASLEGVREAAGGSWDAISPESAARMRAQNRFKTGLDIAQYTADIMRRDMAEYDADTLTVHPVPGLLARFHRPAENDFHQEAFWQQQEKIPLPVGLDGCSAAVRVRSAARSVHARENLGVRADRRAVHLPAPGRCPRIGRPVPRAGCSPGSRR